jgi:hypothetical protein
MPSESRVPPIRVRLGLLHHNALSDTLAGGREARRPFPFLSVRRRPDRSLVRLDVTLSVWMSHSGQAARPKVQVKGPERLVAWEEGLTTRCPP